MDTCGRALARLGLPGGPIDHEPTRAGLLTTTGLCLRALGRYKTADEAYQLAIAHAEKEPGEILAIALGNYGALWSILGDPRHALALYEEALRVLDRYAAGSEQRAWILRNQIQEPDPRPHPRPRQLAQPWLSHKAPTSSLKPF